MITCPNCGTTDLRGSRLFEGGITNELAIVSNPTKSDKVPETKLRNVSSENSTVTLVCKKCGVESELESGVQYHVTYTQHSK